MHQIALFSNDEWNSATGIRHKKIAGFPLPIELAPVESENGGAGILGFAQAAEPGHRADVWSTEGQIRLPELSANGRDTFLIQRSSQAISEHDLHIDIYPLRRVSRAFFDLQNIAFEFRNSGIRFRIRAGLVPGIPWTWPFGPVTYFQGTFRLKPESSVWALDRVVKISLDDFLALNPSMASPLSFLTFHVAAQAAKPGVKAGSPDAFVGTQNRGRGGSRPCGSVNAGLAA